ncbi:MAG: hypothetical protein JRN53_05350 [Nitrososphaerota archaeon]|nr:hypothetical protein [Nitrososphaerota archaeon]
MLKEEARQRQIELAGTRPNTNPDLSQNFDEGSKGRSDEQAGKLLGVNRTYVSTVKSVLIKAPELKERIMNGDIKLLEAKASNCCRNDVRKAWQENK